MQKRIYHDKELSELFNNFSTLIIFLHVISAIVWIGGMIVIRFAVHYSMQNIEDPKIKLGRTLENLKRFFSMVIPSIITLLITAIILILALDFKDTELYKFVSAKNQLNPLAKYLIPINIFLGIIAVILGITLRGF